MTKKEKKKGARVKKEWKRVYEKETTSPFEKSPLLYGQMILILFFSD